MNKRIVVALLVGCMLLSFTACNSGSDNRETTFNKETLDTVNPDLSQPEQSIPSDAMITETETESTAPVKNGNTYTINGVEFTISVRIEDYLYDLPGSDAKFIDLDKFMEAYGFQYTGDAKAYGRCSYSNSDDIHVTLDKKNTSFYSDGLEVCASATIAYPSGFSTDGVIALISMSSDFSLDTENHVYIVNGYVEDGKIRKQYCVSQEMLVVFAVTFDALNNTGSTASAVEPLSRALECTTVNDVRKMFIK